MSGYSKHNAVPDKFSAGSIFVSALLRPRFEINLVHLILENLKADGLDET